MKKIIHYEEKGKKILDCCYKKCNSVQQKKSNKFTWFHYGRLALQIYLWCLDNKELLSEIFHSIIDFVFE